jgi:predicted porin
MRKTSVTAAIAAGFATCASAQSTVTIYGIIDVAAQVVDFDRPAAGSLKTVNSGHRNGSRLGFRGTEDLGGGLNALFHLEQGLLVDTGTLGQGGRAFGRQAYVGLGGKFGTLALGRISTFDGGAFDMFTLIDPFQAGFGVATLASTFSPAGGFRVDNAIMVRTPSLAGFQAGYLHSFQTNGSEAVGTGGNLRFDHLGANYRSGDFYGAVTYSVARFPDASNLEKQKILQVGGMMDFKVVKLHATFGAERNARSALISSVGNTADGTDANSWMLGATIPAGSTGKVIVGFQKRDGKEQRIGNSRFDADRRVFGLAYEYLLSRRTIVHASFGKSEGAGTLREGAAATDLANRKEVTVGITHFF